MNLCGPQATDNVSCDGEIGRKIGSGMKEEGCNLGILRWMLFQVQIRWGC